VPKVGSRSFPYTAAGEKAAAAASKKSGKPMEVDKSKMKKSGKKAPPFPPRGGRGM